MATPVERLNLRTRTKAAIKRATFAAHREANRLDDRALAELDAMYRRAADELRAAVVAYADESGNLRLQVSEQLLGQVNGIIDRLGQQRDGRLDSLLGDAADIALSSYGQVAGDAFLTRVSEQAVKFVHDFIDNEGLNLSARLWRLDQGAKTLVGNAIKNAVIQGHGPSEAVNNLLNRGEPVPAALLKQRDIANAAQAGRLAGEALMTGEGNPRANALRVFRTELNRAHGEAYMMGGEDHPDFGGWKFLLSPRHPRTDICDMHAHANLYGLGEGVYPDRKRCPWPAHPNTLSYVVIVFADEITEEDRAGKTTRLDWLKDQPQDRQEAVLNSRKKAAALRAGILRENQIATPWRDLQPRYEKQGIDVDSLGSSGGGDGFGIAGDISAPIAVRAPRGIPVSNALEPQAHADVSNRVLAAIDRVHGDGRLPTIPIQRFTSRTDAGVYGHISETGRAVYIKLSQLAPNERTNTLAHEIGHFLDDQALARGAWSSATDKRFAGWRDAVKQSAAARRFEEILRGPPLIRVPSGGYFSGHRIARYYLSTEELWARSYAQYIAIRSGDALMLDELNGIIARERAAEVWLPSQWEHEDFSPIGEAIDALFIKLGWTRG